MTFIYSGAENAQQVFNLFSYILQLLRHGRATNCSGQWNMSKGDMWHFRAETMTNTCVILSFSFALVIMEAWGIAGSK